MKETIPVNRKLRCAVYTRKSPKRAWSRNSIASMHSAKLARLILAARKAEGWLLVADHYDDGGFSGRHIRAPCP